jgi:hypothetical protein
VLNLPFLAPAYLAKQVTTLDLLSGGGSISASGADPLTIGSSIATVREAAERAGRNPDDVRIICRTALRHGVDGLHGSDGQRKLLSGATEQILGNVEWLGEQGVTELFYDLNFDNFDPAIGSPEADAAASADRAEKILRALAPSAG